MKAKLKALNVLIGGKLYLIEDKYVFDTEKTPSLKAEIEAKIKSGHLVLVGNSKEEVKVDAKVEPKTETKEEVKVDAKVEPKTETKEEKPAKDNG
jgi:hypothetical protein